MLKQLFFAKKNTDRSGSEPLTPECTPEDNDDSRSTPEWRRRDEPYTPKT